MPSLKYWDQESGKFHRLVLAFKGEKGEKGDKGDPGAATGMGALDELIDVSGAVATPAGKLLGTTGTGAWGPVDPPAVPPAPDLTPYATKTYVDTENAKQPTQAYIDGRIWSGTQAAYDAIATKDPTVLYVVV